MLAFLTAGIDGSKVSLSMLKNLTDTTRLYRYQFEGDFTGARIAPGIVFLVVFSNPNIHLCERSQKLYRQAVQAFGYLQVTASVKVGHSYGFAVG